MATTNKTETLRLRKVHEKVSSCRSCGAAIVWGVTAKNGKNVPINADAAFETDGADSDFRTIKSDSVHFVTCPQGPQHRKPRKATAPDKAVQYRQVCCDAIRMLEDNSDALGVAGWMSTALRELDKR